MKFDIIMWAKNGEKFLPLSLKRVEDAIPKGYVHKKILVDDHSTDDTVSLAKGFGWEVYANPSHGISSGANEALKHVDCDYFMSLEQDLLLSYDWIQKIPKYMKSEDVAVAQGIRIATEPTLRIIDTYAYKRVAMKTEANPTRFGFSMDNNLFKTQILKMVGGFPNECPVCTDGILMQKLNRLGYKWITDASVVSDHIRPSLKEYYRHQYYLINRCALGPLCFNRTTLRTTLRIFLTSPLRGAMMAVSTGNLPLLWVYPKIRWHRTKAMIDHMKGRFG